MKRPTVNIPDVYDGQFEVDLNDAMRAVARYASEMVDAARMARNTEMRDAFLTRARMLQALTYFAMPGVVDAKWIPGNRLRGSFELDEAALASFKGGSTAAIDLMLADLRADLIARVAQGADEDERRSALAMRRAGDTE